MQLPQNTAERKHRHCRAFTMLELVVVIVVVIILFTLLIPTGGHGRVKAQRIKCVSNLKQIALAFKMYAGDNNEKLPWEITAESTEPRPLKPAWQYFQTISHQLESAKLLTCPGDVSRLENRAANFSDGPEGLLNSSNRNNAVSYFLGTFTSSNQPNAILVGDRNLALNEKALPYASRGARPVEVATNSVWSPLPRESHHDNAGNYAPADGSVKLANNDRLQEALRLARNSYGTNANRFLFPQ